MNKRPRTMSDPEAMQLVPIYNGPYPWTRMTGGNRVTLPSTRRRYSRRRYDNGPYSQLGSNVTHVNPRFPPPEIKTIDSGVTGATPVAPPVTANMGPNGDVVVLNDLASGNGAGQRIGLSIVVKNCSYRFEIDLPTAGAVATSGRVMLVWDRQPNGVAATYLDIFSTASYLSFGSTSGLQRFVILRNQQFSLSPNGTQSLFFEGFCKINMKSTYPAGANVPITGALLLVYISDQAPPSTALPVLQGTWRVRFVDV